MPIDYLVHPSLPHLGLGWAMTSFPAEGLRPVRPTAGALAGLFGESRLDVVGAMTLVLCFGAKKKKKS